MYPKDVKLYDSDIPKNHRDKAFGRARRDLDALHDKALDQGGKLYGLEAAFMVAMQATAEDIVRSLDLEPELRLAQAERLAAAAEEELGGRAEHVHPLVVHVCRRHRGTTVHLVRRGNVGTKQRWGGETEPVKGDVVLRERWLTHSDGRVHLGAMRAYDLLLTRNALDHWLMGLGYRGSARELVDLRAVTAAGIDRIPRLSSGCYPMDNNSKAYRPKKRPPTLYRSESGSVILTYWASGKPVLAGLDAFSHASF